MSRFQLILFPVLVVAFLLVVDKIALIPAVAEAGKARHDEMEKYNDYAYTVVDLADRKRPTVAVMGTSQAAIVRHLTPREIDRGGLTPAEKKEMGGLQFLNLTVFGSDMFWQYATLFYLLEKERLADRFDYFFVELSPIMINRARPLNLARDYISVMNMEPDFILRTLPFSSGALRRELLTRLAFASYSRHFSPFRAIENTVARLNGRRKDPFKARMEQYYFRMLALGPEDVHADLVDFDERDRIPEHEYRSRFSDFSKMAMPYYETDPNQLQAFYEMIRMLKHHGIPTLVWMPMSHPEMIRRYHDAFEPQLPEIRRRVEESGALFYDLREHYPEFECKRFVDANHMSPRCTTLVFRNLLRHIDESGRPVRLRSTERVP